MDAPVTGGEPLTAREVRRGDVVFRIGKMLPMEAKQLFTAHVRPLMGGALKAESTDGANAWHALLAAFTEAPQAHYEAVSQALLARCTFKHGTEPEKPLLSDMEYAFKDLEMIHILDLEVRAFVVNFRGSLSALRTLYPKVGEIIDRLERETSTLSSPSPSTPDSADSPT